MSGNLSFWLTPLWTLSVGVTLGAAVLLLIYGMLWLVSRKAAAAVLRTGQESVLQWISYVVLVYVALCFLATPMMPWGSVSDSLRRLPYVGESRTTVTIPPRTDDLEVAVNFNLTSCNVFVRQRPGSGRRRGAKGKAYSDPLILVEGGEPYEWSPSSKVDRNVHRAGRQAVRHQPERRASRTDHRDHDRRADASKCGRFPIAAAGRSGVYLVYLLLHWLLPGVSTIALATSKEAIAQPLYLLAHARRRVPARCCTSTFRTTRSAKT